MNEYEKANLARLSRLNAEAATIKQLLESASAQGLKEAAKEAAKLYTAGLFEIHRGDTTKVKAQLRQDADLFKNLDLTTIINDCYTKYAKATARYDEAAHAKFELWFERIRRTGESSIG